MHSREASVYTANSVQEFLEYLLPNATHWRSAKRGDLAYRGQASSCWPLIPKAFRNDVIIGYGSNAPKGGSSRVVPQSRAEFCAVNQFVKSADMSGLQIPETGNRLLLQDEPRHIFNDGNWEYKWPQQSVLETLALAQHHGVPTRLLDFTEDALTAAYFSAYSAWDPQTGRRLKGEDRKYISVWVIDLRFIRAISSIPNRYPERIAEIRVPRSNNPYLYAQSGFFLLDRGANDLMAKPGLLSIDTAVADRARFWHYGERLPGNRVKQTWFDQLPIRQVILCANLIADLLRELEGYGVTKGKLMPSLDRVVESLEFQRSIPPISDGEN